MSKLDLLKFLESYDGDVELADFAPDELQELLDSMHGDRRPLTKEELKEAYFAYYDDVKDKSRKRQDW